MAIRITCDNPQALLDEIRSATSKNIVRTWSVDDDGDFTHTPDQWSRKAWLRPRVRNEELVFSIVGPKRKRISVTTYAVYHGRFVEMLLSHFDKKFTRVVASALPTLGDKLGGSEEST